MLRFIIIALLISSCVTTNKIKRYMSEHRDKAAEICLEQFPQTIETDTILYIKDSFITQKITDTIYNWFIDHKYSEPIIKEKIKKIVSSYHDTVLIKVKVWDDRYKVLYEKKDKELAILEDKYKRKSKALFYTWLWIGVIGVGAFAYKKYL
jgi:hypothetical protein